MGEETPLETLRSSMNKPGAAQAYLTAVAEQCQRTYRPSPSEAAMAEDMEWLMDRMREITSEQVGSGPFEGLQLDGPVTFHDARLQVEGGEPFAARVHFVEVEDAGELLPAVPLARTPVSVEFTATDLTVWRMRELRRSIARAFDIPLSVLGLDRPSVLNAEYRRRQKNRVKRRRR